MATLIQQFRTEIHGEVSDRRRVIDNLLDVRLAMVDHHVVVDEVDRLLGELPGLTTVENEWWNDALDALDRALALVAS